MFSSSSADENHINTLFIWFLILSAFIMIIVFGAVLTGAIRYNAKRRPDEPEQLSGNKVLEITWTIVPFIILTVFFYFTVVDMKEINRSIDPGRQPDIKVIAHQWWWEMQYPKLNINTANELHIPAGRQLLMQLESADVIHDWWVPALGRKIDAIPGRTNFSWIDANMPGEYQGLCSEYCGTQHAHMRILVIAHDTTEFHEWVVAQKKTANIPADSLGKRGYRLFMEKTCLSCHTIEGVSATGHIGPDLTHLSSRKTLLSGMLPNTPENLTLWLQDPQKIKEGALMPNFILTHDELKALVTYLEDLK